MGWFGKFACAFIGFQIARFPGLIVGLIVGHLVDSDDSPGQGPHSFRAQHSLFNRARNGPSVEDRHQIFFVSVFSMLARLARADGRITLDEIASIEKFMDHDLGLDPSRKAHAKNIFRAARASEKPFGDYAKEFYRVFRHQPSMLENALDILFRISVADGELNQAEENLLRQATLIFKLPADAFERIWSRYRTSPDRFYQVLGCTRSSSEKEIKKRYRTLVFEHHPDRIVSQGQPESFVKLANEKFREIQEAYDAIKAEKGFS